MENMIKVEFVCSGNTFRSRLAEAYLKSKMLEGVEVSSSGTRAESDKDGPITWWAQRIITNAGLIIYQSRDWRQVTPEILSLAGLVIFLGNNNYEYCREQLGFTGKYQVWDIPDLDVYADGTEIEAELIKRTDEIFTMIISKTDILVSELAK